MAQGSVSRASPRQFREQIKSSGHQRFLLGARPTLDLPFGRDGIDDVLEVIGIGEDNGSARGSVTAEMPRLVLRDSNLEIGACRSCVVGVIGALKDVSHAPIGLFSQAPAFGHPSRRTGLMARTPQDEDPTVYYAWRLHQFCALKYFRSGGVCPFF